MNLIIFADIDTSTAEALIACLSELPSARGLQINRQTATNIYNQPNTTEIITVTSVSGEVSTAPTVDIINPEIEVLDGEIQTAIELEQPSQLDTELELELGQGQEISQSAEPTVQPIKISTCTILSLDSRACVPAYYDKERNNSVLKVPYVNIEDDYLVFEYLDTLFKYPIQKTECAVDNSTHALLGNTIKVAIRFENSTESRPYLIDVEAQGDNERNDVAFMIFGADYDKCEVCRDVPQVPQNEVLSQAD